MKFIKLLIISIICFTLVGCGTTEEKVEYDKSTFNVIEDLKTVSVDMFVYTDFNDPDHVFRKLSFNEALRLYDEEGTGILFYGYPTCGVCPMVLPSLNEAAKTVNSQIYYVDLNSETINEADMEHFEDLAHDHLYLEDDGTRSFRVPMVVVVINGEIVDSHIGHLGAKGSTLDEGEKAELQSFYEDMFYPFK